MCLHGCAYVCMCEHMPVCVCPCVHSCACVWRGKAGRPGWVLQCARDPEIPRAALARPSDLSQPRLTWEELQAAQPASQAW